MATIPNVNFPDGQPISHAGGDIDYLVDSDAVDASNANRPVHNLSYRDVQLRDGLNQAIDAINDAFAGNNFLIPNSQPGHATPLGSLEEMLAVSLNADGTLKGGSAHPPVTVQSPELQLVTTPTEQQLSVSVGTGPNTLAVGNDSRFHTSDPTNSANNDHDNRYIPEVNFDSNGAARLGLDASAYTNVPTTLGTVEQMIDALEQGAWAVVGKTGHFTSIYDAIAAGCRRIRVFGTVNDTGKGMMTVSEPLFILGEDQNAVWQHDGLTIDGNGSIVRNLLVDTGDVTVNASGCVLENLIFQNVPATKTACLVINGSYNLIRNVREIVTGAGAVNGQALLSLPGSYNHAFGVFTQVDSGTGITSTDYRIRVTGIQNVLSTLYSASVVTALYVGGSGNEIENCVLGSGMTSFAILENAVGATLRNCDFRGATSTTGSIDAPVVVKSGCRNVIIAKVDMRLAAAGAGAGVLVFVTGAVERLTIEDVDAAYVHAIVTNDRNAVTSISGLTLRRIALANMTSADVTASSNLDGGLGIFITTTNSFTLRDVNAQDVDAYAGLSARVRRLFLFSSSTAQITLERICLDDVRVHSEVAAFGTTGSNISINDLRAENIIVRGTSSIYAFSLKVIGGAVSSGRWSFENVKTENLASILDVTAEHDLSDIVASECQSEKIGFTLQAISATIKGVVISDFTLVNPNAGSDYVVKLDPADATANVIRVVVAGGYVELNSTIPAFEANTAVGSGTKQGVIYSVGYRLTGTGGFENNAAWNTGQNFAFTA